MGTTPSFVAVFALITFPCFSLSEAVGSPSPLSVSLEDGVVVGTYGVAPLTNKSTRQFFGIPFAAPPVNNLRWRRPQPVTPWTHDLVCSQSGPACPQTWDGNEPLIGQKGQSEDCLYVNVVTPKYPVNDSLPVLIYVFGGSFEHGDSSLYSESGIGGNLATDQEDIIFVVFNYRLGIFGYLAMDALADEDSSANTTGNYGFQDQRFAFEWVQRNVAAFGGDPGRVTISGQSAGGIALGGHLMSQQTAPGTFQSVFFESGSIANIFAERAAAVAMGASIADCVVSFYGSRYYTGASLRPCEGGRAGDGGDAAAAVACMRAMEWDDLIYMTTLNAALGCNGNASFSFSPVIDGFEWTKGPLQLAEAGGALDGVAVMIGDVLDEATLFLSTKAKLPSKPIFDAALLAMWSFLGHGPKPGHGVEALKLYHPSKFAHFGNLSTWAALSAMAGDALFQCPNRRLARALVREGRHAVYAYEFMHAPACWTPSYAPIHDTLPVLGAFHESDLPYFFAAPDANAFATRPCTAPLASPLDPAQVRQCGPGIPVANFSSACPLEPHVLEAYFGYLTNFVRNAGNPNPVKESGLPYWPAFNDAEERMGINVSSAVLDGTFNKRKCDFWDKIDLDAVVALLHKYTAL